jgi:hypothetical protein
MDVGSTRASERLLFEENTELDAANGSPVVVMAE